jgi:hypothetical protein
VNAGFPVRERCCVNQCRRLAGRWGGGGVKPTGGPERGWRTEGTSASGTELADVQGRS